MGKAKPLRPPTDVREEVFDTRQVLLNVNRRMQTAVVASAIAAASAAGSLLFLMPLKKTIPYVIEVNRTTGAVVVPQQQPMAGFLPDARVKLYFVREWIENLLSINQYTFGTTDPEAQFFLRGKNAIAEFRAFREQDGTYSILTKNPGAVRKVSIQGVTPVAGTQNGVVAQVQTTMLVDGRETTQDWLLTVYWAFIPPQTREDVLKNPIGLWIVDFKVSKASGASGASS